MLEMIHPESKINIYCLNNNIVNNLSVNEMA